MGLTDFMEGCSRIPRDLCRCLRALSSDGRVLFGSDFPNIPYPFAHQVEVLIDHGLDMPAAAVARARTNCSSISPRGRCSPTRGWCARFPAD